MPSITQLKANLIDEFSDVIPHILDFDLGWCEGNTRKLLVVPAKMYLSCAGNEISLWCDVSPSKKKKQSQSESSSKKDDDDTEAITEQLFTKHGDKYDKPTYRLWAQMLHCGSHKNYDKPPKLPEEIIAGPSPKRHKPDFSESFRDAAVAVVRALSPPPSAVNTVTSSNGTAASTTSSATTSATISVGISPGRKVDLRGKNYQQLRQIQTLYEDSILSIEEFTEQKEMILEAIRKLNKKLTIIVHCVCQYIPDNPIQFLQSLGVIVVNAASAIVSISVISACCSIVRILPLTFEKHSSIGA